VKVKSSKKSKGEIKRKNGIRERVGSKVKKKERE
jgi:hypothetical protein